MESHAQQDGILMTKRDFEDWKERFKATYPPLMGWCPSHG